MASLLSSVSDPVEIPNTKNKNNNDNLLFSNDEAYMVTSHIFDPYRSSPPSSWNLRLKKRIELFENKEHEKEKEKISINCK